jgi:hypothetical protein
MGLLCRLYYMGGIVLRCVVGASIMGMDRGTVIASIRCIVIGI